MTYTYLQNLIDCHDLLRCFPCCNVSRHGESQCLGWPRPRLRPMPNFASSPPPSMHLWRCVGTSPCPGKHNLRSGKRCSETYPKVATSYLGISMIRVSRRSLSFTSPGDQAKKKHQNPRRPRHPADRRRRLAPSFPGLPSLLRAGAEENTT
jgi:hypothetical protein